MSDIGEDMLIAWCDGELDEVTRRRVDRAVAEDPALAERLAAHQRLRDRLAGHYAPVAEQAVPDRFAALLAEAAVVMPFAPVRASPWRGWAVGGALAASLVLGLGIGRLSGDEAGPIAVRDGRMMAQGVLASALDGQLASAQTDAAIRIGLSFQRKGGGWCRSFDGAAMSGLACRDGKGWQLQQALPGHGSDEAAAYRQAASADPRLVATVEALIDGAPADAAAEAKAKAEGWR